MNQPWIYILIPPPTSLSTRFLWVFPVHQARALVSCIQPGLVICFALDKKQVRFFICEFSCFLRQACSALNFPFRTDFAEFHRFWKVAFLISSLTHCCYCVRFFFFFFWFWVFDVFTSPHALVFPIFPPIIGILVSPYCGR